MSRPKNRRFSMDARLDWLQLTAFTNKIKSDDFADRFYTLKRKLNEDGFEQENVSFPRYKGHRVGPFMFMTNHKTEHRMIIASGASAPLLGDWAIENDLCANPSRVDGKLIMTFEEPQPNYGEWARTRIHQHEQELGRKTQTALELYDARHADSGIRSGAKEADIKWRLYDHGLHHQKRMDSRVWSGEVQLHNNPAKKFWTDYIASSDKTKLCSDMVTTRFRKLGVNEPGWNAQDNYKVSGTRTLASMEGKLLHFDTVCMVTLKKLIEAGYAGDVRAMFKSHGLLDDTGQFLPMWAPDDVSE